MRLRRMHSHLILIMTAGCVIVMTQIYMCGNKPSVRLVRVASAWALKGNSFTDWLGVVYFWKQILIRKFIWLIGHYFYGVAIGKPERQVRKASHCGSKQQERSHDEITLVVTISKYYQLFNSFTSVIRGYSPRSVDRDHSFIACSRDQGRPERDPRRYIWVLFFAHIPFVVNRTLNATPTERLQQWLEDSPSNLLIMLWKWDVVPENFKLAFSRVVASWPPSAGLSLGGPEACA